MKRTIISLTGLFVMLILSVFVSAALPTITDVQPSPSEIYTDTDVKFNMTITDNDDNETLTGYVQFYVNGIAKGTAQSNEAENNTNTLIATLASSNFIKDDEIIAEYWAGDGVNLTAKTNITAGTVSNTQPIIAAGIINIDNDEDSDSITIPASDLDEDTLTYTITQGNTSIATCSVSGNTLKATRYSDDTEGTTICTVTVSDGEESASAAFTINVDEKSDVMLDIYDLDVYVDNERSSNLIDGDKIGEEAKPDSTVRFEFIIENLYTRDEDIEIEDVLVTITIRDIDDGDDLEEESREFDIDPGKRSDRESIEFNIPSDVESGDYDVEFIVEGWDEDSGYHKIEWELTLEVTKDRDDIRLRRFNTDQSTLSCNRYTMLNIELMNYGRNDQDEIIVEIENSELGINFKEEYIEIDEGDNWRKSYPITISDNVKQGTYRVTAKVYYDSDDYYDDDFIIDAYNIIDIVVQDCVETVPDDDEDDDEDENGEDVIVIPTEPTTPTTPTGDVTREISFQDTSLYLVLLVGTVLILGLIFLILVFKLLSK